MILYHWRGEATNFGDELNTLLWPALLPGFFDSDTDVRFLGIGSVLDSRHPAGTIKLVAGSGYGGYEAKPRLDRSWVIHWVRGPRTASQLSLPAGLALGDPALLLPSVLNLPPAQGRDIGFVPHFETAARGLWHLAAPRAGIRLIDPREPPLRVLAAMAACRLILSEALHGVIVADALRIPWIPIRPFAPVHRAKWADWLSVMQLRPRFVTLPASCFGELAAASPFLGSGRVRHWLTRRSGEPVPDRALDPPAAALRQAANAAPQISCDAVLERSRARMLERVHDIQKAPFEPPAYGRIRPARQRPTPIRQSPAICLLGD